MDAACVTSLLLTSSTTPRHAAIPDSRSSARRRRRIRSGVTPWDYAPPGSVPDPGGSRTGYDWPNEPVVPLSLPNELPVELPELPELPALPLQELPLLPVPEPL